MTAKTFSSDGFNTWLKFNGRSKAELMKELPRDYGVYVIRRIHSIRRARGDSDIIYVGFACNENGLRGRVGQYFSPGPSQPTNRRILALVAESE